MKLSKYAAASLLSLSLVIGTCGCDKDFTKGTPFDTGKNVENTTTSGPSDSETKKPDQNKNEIVTTPDYTVTDSPVSPTVISEPVSPTSDIEPTPDSTAETPSDTPAITSLDPTPTSVPVSRDRFDRTEYRNLTFLIWLPAFEYGAFIGQESKGTFDYAIFSDVTKDEVMSYISELKNAGYTISPEESFSSDSGSYSAYNDKDWKAVLNYKDNTLTLGSGFDESREDDQNDDIRMLYTTTMLQYVPEFKGGSYLGSSGTSSTESSYIMYNDITREDVLSYIEKVKTAGYIYAPEEDYSDTSIWYIALNEESFECRVQYDGSIIKIECADCRED